MGIRVIYGGALAFGATNTLEKAAVKDADRKDRQDGEGVRVPSSRRR